MRNIIAIGIVCISIARGVFIVSSYALHLFLGRYLGPADYGVVGILLALLIFFRVFLKDGLFHAVSRYTSAHHNQSRSIRRKILKLQLVLVFLLSGVYFFSSNIMADFLHDPKFISYIRLSAFILPPIGLFFIYMGSLNGLRLFHKQALGSGFYGIMRFLCVFAFVMLGLRINGIIFGLFLAPLMALILTRYLCISSESDQEGDFNLSIKEILPFAAPIILFSAGITILMSLDLFLVKSLLRSNDQTGFYTAATMIGKLPYHFIVSFTLTLFPSVSRAHAQNNLEKIRHYIRRFAKYITHIMLPTVTIISILASEIITIIYSKRFIPSSQPLSIIIWGNAFLAYFLFCSTIFMAIGRPKTPFFFLCISLPLAIILNLHLIPKYNLIGAALATTLSHLTGLILSSWYVMKCLNISISIKTIFITILGISTVIISSYLLPLHGLLILIKCFILFLIYITIMVICKEINIEDIKSIREIFIRT